MCIFYRQVLVLGEPSPFFQGGQKRKLTMGLMGFFSKASLRDGLRKIRKTVTCICGVGARFKMVLVWAGPSPNFFRSEKMKIL